VHIDRAYERIVEACETRVTGFTIATA
jgi:hypothetical protein